MHKCRACRNSIIFKAHKTTEQSQMFKLDTQSTSAQFSLASHGTDWALASLRKMAQPWSHHHPVLRIAFLLFLAGNLSSQEAIIPPLTLFIASNPMLSLSPKIKALLFMTVLQPSSGASTSFSLIVLICKMGINSRDLLSMGFCKYWSTELITDIFITINVLI